MFLRRICSGRTNIPSMGLLVLFSTSKCMVFISVRHNDRSTADLGFSFDLFVNGCDGNPTNYTLFISGGFYFRKSNRCFIHLSASSRCIGTVSGRDRLAAVLAFLSSSLQAQALGSRRGAKGIRLQWKMGKCVQS